MCRLEFPFCQKHLILSAERKTYYHHFYISTWYKRKRKKKIPLLYTQLKISTGPKGVFFTSWNTVFKSYIQVAVTYMVLLQKNVWQLLERKTVVCCRDLSTGHVLMTVDTWYPLAQSFKLFNVSVRAAGKICCCKALSCRTYRSCYMLLSREATHSCAAGATVRWRDNEAFLTGWEECQVSFGQQWWSKTLLGPAGWCFTDFTFEF